MAGERRRYPERKPGYGLDNYHHGRRRTGQFPTDDRRRDPVHMSSLHSSRSIPASFATGRAWLARHERWLWVVVVVALVGDLWLTAYGLSQGYAEANPLARSVLAVHGIAGLGGLKLFALGVGVAGRCVLPRRYAPIVPLGLALPWAFAVCSNATLLVVS